MSIETTNVDYSKPRRIAWPLGIVGATLLGTMVYIGDSVATASFYAGLQKSFSAHLESSDDPMSELDEPRYFQLTKSTREVIDYGLKIKKLIRKKSYDNAEILVSKKKLPQTKEFVDFQEALKKANEFQKENGGQSKKQEKIQRKLQLHVLSFTQLKNEFVALIGFQSTQTDGGEQPSSTEEDELKVYSEGLFSGLPEISGIPDVIRNAEELKALFAPKGLQNTFEALNKSDSELNLSLAQMRNKILRIKSDHAALALLLPNNSVNQVDTLDDQDALIRLIDILILQSMSEGISETKRKIYRNARKLLGSKQLPALI